MPDVLDFLELRGVREHSHASARVRKDVQHLLRGQGRVNGNGHGTRNQQREVRQLPFGPAL